MTATMPAAAITPVRLEVFGVPQPQGSKTGFLNKRTGRVTMVEGRRGKAREAFKSWREGITHAAQRWQETHHAAPIDEPVRVSIQFRLPRPKSAPKRRVWPDTRPDLDKLVRAVLDGIGGVLITNDSRVCRIVTEKVYAAEQPPGCVIVIERLDS